MSKFVSTRPPSTSTWKTRCPACWVQVHRLAKYIRTLTSVPAGTGKAHSCSWPPAASHSSSSKTARGVPAGTVESTDGTVA